jgi:predicted Zn-dependent peptidase
MKTTEYTLENGLRVIHNQREDSKMVDVRLILEAGNFYNSYYGYTPGIAHFVEHVVHEKTEKYKNKMDLTSLISDNGGVRNAGTYSDERMEFFATVLKEFSKDACDYVSQVVFHAQFDQVAVDKHKKIILEEYLAKYKKPDAKAYKLFGEISFSGTNFVFPTLGTEESISNTTLEELTRYYNERFTTNNSILSVSGDITLEECKKLVDEFFSNARQSTNSNNTDKTEESVKIIIPKILNKKQENILIPDKQAVVNFGATFDGIGDAKYFSLFVLLRFMTMSATSILNRRLREENSLLYGIGSSLEGTRLFGRAYFSLNVQPENIQQCLDIIKYEINEISTGKITDQELSGIKIKIEASEIFNNQSIQGESDYYSTIRLFFPMLKNKEEYINKFLSVSRDEIISSAKWLHENLNILAVCSNSENKYNF